MKTFPLRSGIWSTVKRVAGGKTSVMVCHKNAIVESNTGDVKGLEGGCEALIYFKGTEMQCTIQDDPGTYSMRLTV